MMLLGHILSEVSKSVMMITAAPHSHSIVSNRKQQNISVIFIMKRWIFTIRVFEIDSIKIATIFKDQTNKY